MDISMFLDDFEVEAKTHIEKIEEAFLNTAELIGNSALINSVFRAAHSIKGTASFFNLEKIVTVAHELESMLSRIVSGELLINDEIVEIALQSVDCLNLLIANITDDGGVEIEETIEALRKYSIRDELPHGEAAALSIPFDLGAPGMAEALKDAYRFGQKIFYITIGFNRSLGRYYAHPKGLIDNILSVGSIIAAIVDCDTEKLVSGSDTAAMTEKLVGLLTENDTATLGILAGSVLDAELLQAALELDEKNLRPIPKESIPGGLGAPAPAAPPKPDSEHGKEKNEQQTIRLDVAVINQLMDLTNEMILARNRLLSTLSDSKKTVPGLTYILNDVDRLTSDIQEKVMLTRMQPVSVIFNKFPRIIHDLSKSLKKDIELEILGDKVTLDKFLLESLTDPITQLVKNSADHGIEPAEQREAAGKPQKGKITLNAYMREGSAIIDITDNGKGMDAEALGRKGVERGIVTEERLAEMTDSEKYALAFEPGISTATKVTSLSGRGVGMDIVLTNIQRLGGSVEIESELGKGTTVRLKMPITLSVTRTLIVVINGVLYAVPEVNIEHIVRLERNAPGKRLDKVNKSLVLELDGRIIPVVTMEDIEAKTKGATPPDAKTLLKKAFSDGVAKCLVLKSGDTAFALLIDDALKTEQTLVKPLPVYLKNCRVYSSTTILGNGSAIAILDTEGIIRHMHLEIADNSLKTPGETEALKDKKQIIIFMCSGPEYFALETGKISRIETVSPDDIQKIGNKQYVNVGDQTVRVVRPEGLMNHARRAYKQEKLYLLTLEGSTPPVGLLTARVLDKAESAFELDTSHFNNPYVLGTSVFEKEILIFLNPDEIVRSKQ